MKYLKRYEIFGLRKKFNAIKSANEIIDRLLNDDLDESHITFESNPGNTNTDYMKDYSYRENEVIYTVRISCLYTQEIGQRIRYILFIDGNHQKANGSKLEKLYDKLETLYNKYQDQINKYNL